MFSSQYKRKFSHVVKYLLTQKLSVSTEWESDISTFPFYVITDLNELSLDRAHKWLSAEATLQTPHWYRDRCVANTMD